MNKKTILFLSLILAGLFGMICCSKQHISKDLPTDLNQYRGTRGDVVVDTTFLVSSADIESYILKIGKSGNKKECKNVSLVTYEGIPTSYLIEYESGWEIVSADKRGPIVLAMAEQGEYDESEMPEAAKEWLARLNEEVAERWARWEPLDEGNEDEVASVDFWSKLVQKVPEEGFETRSIPDDLPIGHFEYFETVIIPEVYDSIPHLLTTHWKQSIPYNHACPDISPLSGEKAPAGCGPVACAQMLYYFHYFWGVPEMAPSYANCTGYTPSSYTFDIPAPNSTTIWSQMNNGVYHTSNKAYVLVADVGYRAGAEYDADETTTSLPDLVDVLSYYGISSRDSVYQKDTVKQSLLRGVPVLTRAQKHNTPDDEAGHAFVIDGYIRYINRIEDHYWWIVEEVPGYVTPDPELCIVFTYSTPYIHLIKMNWGWGETYDSASYSLSGTWAPKEDSIYDHGFRMIHSYGVIE